MLSKYKYFHLFGFINILTKAASDFFKDSFILPPDIFLFKLYIHYLDLPLGFNF